MQKFCPPLRKADNYNSNLSRDKSTFTAAAERVQFRLNDKSSIPASRNDLSNIVIDRSESLRHGIAVKPPARTVSKPETVTDNRDNNHGFMTARNYDNLLKDRKRTLTEAGAEEPARKKLQFNKDGVVPPRNEQTNGASVPSEVVGSVKKVNPPQAVKPERCLTGNVAQVQKFNKDFPNLSAFYEVFAKVHKVDSSKVGRKILLLRNDSGPVLQGIFYEIDVKMIEVKTGDHVRCVGKFINNSRLKLFKVSLIREHKRYVARLYSLAHFELGHQ